jgi:hypothetical protein
MSRGARFVARAGQRGPAANGSRVDRYRKALQGAVAASAAPYGYTLTIWTSGAVLAHQRGIPTGVGATLFMAGAVPGFAVVGLFAYGGIGPMRPAEPAPFSLWQALHFVSVGAAIGSAALIGRAVDGEAAWLLGGLLATILYLCGVGLQLVLGRRRRLLEQAGSMDEGA